MMDWIETIVWFLGVIAVALTINVALWKECDHHGVHAHGPAVRFGERVYFRSTSFPMESCK